MNINTTFQLMTQSTMNKLISQHSNQQGSTKFNPTEAQWHAKHSLLFQHIPYKTFQPISKN